MSITGPEDSGRPGRLDEVLAEYMQRLDRGEAVDRARFLAEHADLAEELRSYFEGSDEVRRLADSSGLEAADQTAALTEHAAEAPSPAVSVQAPTLDTGPGATAAPRVGTKVRYIGDYELLEELGRGGMGVVYKARQSRLKRLVALKMILAGEHAGEKELARFRSEAEAVARLQHPHIVQIFEVGEHDGHPYLSLEFVDGGSLAQKLDGTPLPARPAAQLVETLARAVHAAHQAGVVHRDLKPANVLLTKEGQPKITDFGLAKKLEGEPGVSTPGLTASGTILGTPSYMAPEQAGGTSHQIGPAADVYALGAILYELLTGRPPFRAPTALDTVLQVVSEDPVAPTRLQSKTPRDLETICLKCLHKDPAKRYGGAADLAEDLRRFQAGEPIHARPVGNLERVVKWTRRRPTLAGLILVSTVALVTLLVVGLVYNTRLQRALHEAESQRQRAESRGLSVRRHLYAAHLKFAQEAWERNDLARMEDLLEGLRPQAGEEDLRSFDWYYSWKLCHGDRFTVSTQANQAVAFSPDGRTLAAGGLNEQRNAGEVLLLDPSTGQEQGRIAVPGGGVTCLAYAPGGRGLAIGDNTGLALWAPDTGLVQVPRPEGKSQVLALAYAPDGKTLAVANWVDKSVILWDVAAARERANLTGFPTVARALAFSPDSRLLATGTDGGQVWLWDAAKAKESLRLPGPGQGCTWSLAFSPDGKTLAVGSYGVSLWDPSTGQARPALPTRPGTALVGRQVAFAPDGKTLAGGGALVQLWDLAGGRELSPLKGRIGTVRALAFTSDGHRLVTAIQPADWASPGEVKVWDLPRLEEPVVLPREPDFLRLWGFTPDGQQFVYQAGHQPVKFWGAATGSLRGTFLEPGFTPPFGSSAWMMGADCSPDGRLVVTASAAREKTAQLWDAATGKLVGALAGHARWVYGVVFAPDSRTVATLSVDQTVKLWDPATQKERATLSGHTRPVEVLAFSPDSRLVATGAGDGVVKLWEVATGKEQATLRGKGKGIQMVRFAPDGKTLVTGADRGSDAPGVLQLWDVATAREKAAYAGPAFRDPASVAFAPDSKLLAAVSQVSEGGKFPVKLYDPATGKERGTIAGHGGWIPCLAFAPDGKTLATGSWDKTVKLWDVASLQQRASLQEDGEVESLAFAPDGKTLVTGVRNVKSHLWDTATFQPRAALAGSAVDGTRFLALSPDGRLLVTTGYNGPLAYLWDLATGKEQGTVACGALSPLLLAGGGSSLVTGSSFGQVVLWDTATRKPRGTLVAQRHQGFDVTALAFAPDGSTLATAMNDPDEPVRLWDAATHEERGSLPGSEGPAPVLLFSPDNGELAVGRESGAVELWDLKTRARRLTLTGLQGAVAGLGFSPDGTRLVGVSIPAPGVVWDRTSGQQVSLLGPRQGVSRLAFSPDGKTLATAGSTGGTGDWRVTLWDTATWKAKGELRGHQEGVTSLAFAPDGKTLITGSADRTVRFWDPFTFEERQTFVVVPYGPVVFAAVSPDGRTLAVVNAGSTIDQVKLWHAATEAEVPAQSQSGSGPGRADGGG